MASMEAIYHAEALTNKRVFRYRPINGYSYVLSDFGVMIRDNVQTGNVYSTISGYSSTGSNNSSPRSIIASSNDLNLETLSPTSSPVIGISPPDQHLDDRVPLPLETVIESSKPQGTPVQHSIEVEEVEEEEEQTQSVQIPALLHDLLHRSLRPFCRITTCSWFLTSFLSTIGLATSMSIWWTVWRNDVSGGFTLGGFICVAGCGVINELKRRHKESGKCHCQ
jgi:hypothetical protein